MLTYSEKNEKKTDSLDQAMFFVFKCDIEYWGMNLNPEKDRPTWDQQI